MKHFHYQFKTSFASFLLLFTTMFSLMYSMSAFKFKSHRISSLHLKVIYIFLNAISFQDISNHSSQQICFVKEKTKQICWESLSEMVSSCFVHRFEFRVIFLPHWLPTKARGSSTPCYLTHRWEEKSWIHFPRIFIEKWMQQTQLEFELGSPISFQVAKNYTTHTSIINKQNTIFLPNRTIFISKYQKARGTEGK